MNRPMFDLWPYAKLAYEPQRVRKLENASEMVCGDDYGFSLVLPRAVIISFQGTGTCIPGDFGGKVRDWISNFSAFPKMSELEKNGMLIHFGFYEGWKPFKEYIDALIQAPGLSKKRWFVTGHSRGGAIAVLCARHLAKWRSRPCSCVTYGAPAQGGKLFRNEVNMLPIDLTNIQHGYDIVPTMPPRALGYRHAGKEYWWKERLWHKFFCRVADHLPQNYDRWVQRHAI